MEPPPRQSKNLKNQLILKIVSNNTIGLFTYLITFLNGSSKKRVFKLLMTSIMKLKKY